MASKKKLSIYFSFMPRSARIVIPNCPHHIIQRGHNRQTVFVEDEDFEYYLSNLREWKKRLGCKIHAYCLMTNHVHLVVDPGDDPRNLGLLMKRVAGRQTRFVNHLEKRTGSLWEGRYKSSPIDSAEYLLACCRYIELNPLRAAMVERPWQYRWSSCPAKIGLVKNKTWVDLDPFYLAFGENQLERQEEYKKWLLESVPEKELTVIREASQRGQLTGSNKFVSEISSKIGRRVERRGRGRPKTIK